MSVQYQSTQVSGWAVATSFVVTKPTNLAVGDLMILFFASNGTGVGFPSGFAAFLTGVQAADGGAYKSYVQYKFATSGDVAASNFTVTSSSVMGFASITRVTGASGLTTRWKWAGGSTTNTQTPSINASVTPDAAGSNLLMVFWSIGDLATAVSATAIATSNPSWTEAFDTYDAVDKDVCLAYATRPEVTATGNVSATGTNAANDWVVQVISIAPGLIVSKTDSIAISESRKYSYGIIITDALALVDTLTATASRIWTTIAKNIATWINQNKS